MQKGCEQYDNYPLDENVPVLQALPKSANMKSGPSFLSSSYAFLPKPMSTQSLLSQGFCEPMTVYEAHDAIQHGIGVGGHIPLPEGMYVGQGNWSLYEDRPGKPGWISTEKNSTLNVQVKTGEQPRVIIGFLRSYENVGNVHLSVQPGIEKKMVLRGIHKEKTSQIYPLMLGIYMAGRGRIQEMGLGGGWIVKPYSNVTLTFVTLEDKKFKIEYIISC